MFKLTLIFSISLFLSACGTPVTTQQSGIIESQYIIVHAKRLVGYSVSVGKIQDYIIKKADLDLYELGIATSSNSKIEDGETLKIKLGTGEQRLIIKDLNGQAIHNKSYYFSNGQVITITL